MTSGSVVPMETTVAPMSSSGTPNRWAMFTAPSTNQSPPLMRHSSPAQNKITATTMIYSCFPVIFPLPPERA